MTEAKHMLIDPSGADTAQALSDSFTVICESLTSARRLTYPEAMLSLSLSLGEIAGAWSAANDRPLDEVLKELHHAADLVAANVYERTRKMIRREHLSAATH